MTAANWSIATAQHWSWRRLAVALGASLLTHYLVAGGWPAAGGGRLPTIVAPSLHAQLELAVEPRTVPVLPVAESVEPPREHRPAKSSRLESAPVNRTEPPDATAPRETSAAANAGPAIPDSRFFPARELDRYPTPLVPLDLRVPGMVGSVRAWVSIDLAGTVVDVTVIDADPAGVLQRQLREQLLALRFVPGMKDERAVRSRILLELGHGQ